MRTSRVASVTCSRLHLIEHRRSSSNPSLGLNHVITVCLVARGRQLLGRHGVLDRLVSRIIRLLRVYKVNSLFGCSSETRSAALSMRSVVVCASHSRLGHNHLSLRLVLQRLLVLLG